MTILEFERTTLSAEARTLCCVWRVRFSSGHGFSDHRIRDAADFATHIHYIRDNPVRRNLVLQPKEFHWSSASAAYVLNEPPQGLKPLQHEEGAILRRG